MKQLTWMQAAELADKAADQAIGFGPRTGPVPKGATMEDTLKLASRAAAIALEMAGCLAEDKRRDAAIIERAANKAQQEHRAWCKTTGNRC